MKEKEKNSQPLPANWTEDLQIFDANCDDNGDFILILISLDGLQYIYSGHIIYVCQHFYSRKGISATLNSFFSVYQTLFFELIRLIFDIQTLFFEFPTLIFKFPTSFFEFPTLLFPTLFLNFQLSSLNFKDKSLKFKLKSLKFKE